MWEVTSTIEKLSSGKKLAIAMSADAITTLVALPLSFWIIMQAINTPQTQVLWWVPFAAVPITIGLFYFTKVYTTSLRFANASFFIKVMIFSALVAGVVASLPLAVAYTNPSASGFSRGVFPLFGVLLALGSCCSRLFARWYFDQQSNKNRTRAIIYGAGSAGHQLYYALRHGGEYAAIAFVDDDPKRQGKRNHGLYVYSPEDLPFAIAKNKANTILLAMPSISHKERTETIVKLKDLDVEIKTTPNLTDIISGKAALADIHNLSIEDLMARPTVEANEELASRCVQDKTVMVTGAGGSIGSELCRQILRRNPTKIVLFEMTESALFYIEQELCERIKSTNAEIQIVPVLGTILDETCLKEIIQKHGVQTVFHAAAYKHVPMLEENQLEGIRNNVIGTKRVAQACAWAGIESFVVISTDKAVRPTNLMGATKRFAELIVQAVALKNPQMNVCMVRFGNVLGSSGSVVPTFKNQIRRGGPVQVTHREMTRYFMTIPEASQLVMQSGALANSGEVFVLDMGKPVKIYDLAKRMIELSGHSVCNEEHPHGDIDIEICGLRPGEKMFEELSTSGELHSTEHPKIEQSIEKPVIADEIEETAKQLEKVLETGDECEALRLLLLAVPEYKKKTEHKPHPQEVTTVQQQINPECIGLE